MDTAAQLSKMMAANEERLRAQESEVVGEEAPDLTKMPGFRVLRGAERQKAGAAANHSSPPRWNDEDGIYPGR